MVFTDTYRMLVATDRRILVLAGGRWNATTMEEVVAEEPRYAVIGPASGLWWKCESLGSRMFVNRRFHQDVLGADQLRSQY